MPSGSLDPLGFLLGEWSGEGTGLWGTDFAFTDRIRFSSFGRPWIEYRQLTQSSDGPVSHGECGYLIPGDKGTITMTVAEPSGITEVLHGRLEGPELRLSSVAIGAGPRARPVTSTSRRILLEHDQLVVEVAVAMNGEPLSPHTRSVLRRDRSDS